MKYGTYKMQNTIRIRNGHLCVYLASYMVVGVCIKRSNDSFIRSFHFIRVHFNEVLLYVHVRQGFVSDHHTFVL